MYIHVIFTRMIRKEMGLNHAQAAKTVLGRGTGAALVPVLGFGEPPDRKNTWGTVKHLG